jgi:hypothetical protein
MTVCIEVRNVPSELVEQLRGMAEVAPGADGGLVVTVEEGSSGYQATETKKLRRVLDLLDNAGIPLDGIESREANLESLFLQLTGRSLRD